MPCAVIPCGVSGVKCQVLSGVSSCTTKRPDDDPTKGRNHRLRRLACRDDRLVALIVSTNTHRKRTLIGPLKERRTSLVRGSWAPAYCAELVVVGGVAQGGVVGAVGRGGGCVVIAIHDN